MKKDTVSIPYPYGSDTTDTDTDTDTVPVADAVSDTDKKFMESVREIVAYLNETIGTKYKPTSGYIKTLVHARLEEGFTVSDFQTVIWKKAREWKGTKMEQYLRPQTLFGTKFESYLNQTEATTGEGHDALEDFLKGGNDESTGIW